MKFKILAFGIARDIMNGSSVLVETGTIKNAGELKNVLEERYPRLRDLKSFMIAVNDEYADTSTLLSENDEIAVIPPVSGG